MRRFFQDTGCENSVVCGTRQTWFSFCNRRNMALWSAIAESPRTLLYSITVGIIVLWALKPRFSGHAALPLPPGPKGLPILGSLNLLRASKPEYIYAKWTKEYKSDIVSFCVLGQPIIVLNSVQAAEEMLDKRGSNYGDRPRFALFEEMGWRKTLTFLRWGPDFRKHRAHLQKAFAKSNIGQYRQVQFREAALMLQSIANEPASWTTALRRFATAIILGIGFAIKVERDDDPYIQVSEDASYALGHGGTPGGTLIDFAPIVGKLPSIFHDGPLKFARKWRWAILKLHNEPFKAVAASSSSSKRSRSVIHGLLDQRQSQIDQGQVPDMSHDDIKGVGGAMFAAGQDTTWATLTVFILNMVLNPEVQIKAQAELDRVVGRDRLPTFEDRPRLEYINMIVDETLRWCPVSPMGVPHRALHEDTYGGYRIPAGSLVYANAWAMTHNPGAYTEPDKFNPDRFVPRSAGGLNEPPPVGQFGFGRRVCVGRHLAEASIWIVVAMMLSTMDIKKPLDENGHEITPTVELTAGLTSHPEHFDCRIVLRRQQRIDVFKSP